MGKTLAAFICVFMIVLPSFAHPLLVKEGGNADVSRTRNLQPPVLESSNADVSRTRNLQSPELESNNADVSRTRNLQPPVLESSNADVSRTRNLQSPELESNNADASRTRNLQSPTLESNNADVSRTRNLQPPELESNNADISRIRNLQTLELAAPPIFQLTVQVKNSKGLPIVGAEVTAANITLVTDSLGYVFFSLPYGTYNMTAFSDPYYIPTSQLVELYTDKAITLTLEPSSGSEFDVSITPSSITTSIGGIETYTIGIDNYGKTSDVFSIDVNGLETSWYSLEKNQVYLMAGETANLRLTVSVPEVISAVGTYRFHVFVHELLQVEKNASAQLDVYLNPIMFSLEPDNDTTIGSTEILISWETSSNATSEVYMKRLGDSTYNLTVGEWGRNHFVYVYNLTRNTDYVWYAYSGTAYGNVTSNERILHVSNGISFVQDVYTFNVERDYAQHGSVSVVNTDSQAHDLLLNASNPYEDLIVGFVGSGSVDRVVTLSPSETKNVDFYMHAQDAMQWNYTFTIQLTNLGVENIVDYALVRVNVRQPNLNLTLAEEATDPWTLTKALKVTNYGDPITDLRIETSSELVGKVFFRPTVWHAYLAKGESLTFDVIPVLTSNFTSYQGLILAEGAGKILASLAANFTLPVGFKVYQVEAPSLSIEFCSYYDTDESPNTNPNIDKPVESYTVNGTLVYFSQIIVDILQNKASVAGVNVTLTIWNDTWSTTFHTISLFEGKAKFDLVGKAGTYSYQAKLVDYDLSTEVHTFSVSSNPICEIHAKEISWIDVSDGNATFASIDQNTTVVLEKAPFTFRARQPGIEANTTFNLCLTWKLDPYKRIYVPGTIQNDTLVFRTSTIPFGNFSASVYSYSSSHGLAASYPIDVSCVDWLAMYNHGNYTYNLPVPLNSTHLIRLFIDHSVFSRDCGLGFDVSCIARNGADYTVTLEINSNVSMVRQFSISATSGQDVLLNDTLSISLQPYTPVELNFSIPIWRNGAFYDFNFSASAFGTISSSINFKIHPTVDYSFNTFIWVGGEYGILRYVPFFGDQRNNLALSALRCGAGLAIDAGGLVVPWLDKVGYVLDFADIAADVVAEGITVNTFIDFAKIVAPKAAEIVVKKYGIRLAGRAVPIPVVGAAVGGLLDLYECYNDWQRIWNLPDHGLGFIDSIIGFVYHCTNKPIVSFDFPLSFPAVEHSEVHGGMDVYLAPRFLLPWGIRSYSPHDIDIWLNNWLAAEFRMSIPNGHYSLQVDPNYLNLPAGGTAWNRITIKTRYMNGGNYVVATGMLLSILYKRVIANLVASSAEEAQSRMDQLMSSKYANKPDPAVFPEDIATVDHPVEGMQTINFTVWNLGAALAFQVPVQVFDGANLVGDYIVTLGAFQNITLTANWNTTASLHQIRIVVDSQGIMNEIDEHNNQASKTLNIIPSPKAIESCDSAGLQKDTFNPSENMYVTGNVFSLSTIYDIYVVNDTSWSDSKTIPTRVPGTAITISSDSSGNILPTVVWNASLTFGKYDIVIDVNGNGVYDFGIDALDDNDIEVTAGFTVVPEFPNLVIMLLAFCVVSLAFVLVKKKRLQV